MPGQKINCARCDVSRLFSHPEALLNTIERLAIEAGEITLNYFDEAGFGDAQTKEDGSPVTIADKEAEEFIIAALKEIAPGVPIVGEESYTALGDGELDGQDYFWLVDPLDGTREFIQGGLDYTVNIALIHKGVAIMGVICAPALGEIFKGHVELGAVRVSDYGENQKDIRVRRVPKAGYTAIVSKSRGNTPEMDDYLSHFKIEKRISRGSSLKICAVACGKADLYPGMGPTAEWDLAAGHAIIKAAGGNIFDLSGQEINYGHMGRKFLNPNFIVAAEFPFLEQ